MDETKDILFQVTSSAVVTWISATLAVGICILAYSYVIYRVGVSDGMDIKQERSINIDRYYSTGGTGVPEPKYRTPDKTPKEDKQ